jgi:hypothetical protein
VKNMSDVVSCCVVLYCRNNVDLHGNPSRFAPHSMPKSVGTVGSTVVSSTLVCRIDHYTGEMLGESDRYLTSSDGNISIFRYGKHAGSGEILCSTNFGKYDGGSAL